MNINIKYHEGIVYSYLITKTINKQQKKGYKEYFEKCIYIFFKLLKFTQFIKNPIFFFFETIELIRPILNWKLIKDKYFIYSLTSKKSYLLGIEWFIKSGQLLNKKKNFILSYYNEMILIFFYEKKSLAIKKKKQQYIIITKNRFNKYYKW